MSNPEIARRCHVCGASIREAAAFCPQCGEKLGVQNLDEQRPTSLVTAPLVDLATERDEANPKSRRSESEEEKPESRQAAPPKKTLAARAPAGKVRDKIQRATTLARDVEGDVKHRVQKVRQMSSVVLDEAAYDPSLRFVLVAAVLFLLFLLVLLLNKLIG